MLIGFYYLILSLSFYDATHPQLRRLNRFQFDKLVDQENFVVLLICSSQTDQICTKEREKLQTLSQEMKEYSDLVFASIDKATDDIMLARCDVESFPTVKLFPYNTPPQNYVWRISIPDLRETIIGIRNKYIKEDEDSDSGNEKEIESTRIRLTEIDWLDLNSTFKASQNHSMVVVYDDECFQACRIMEKVAKVFEEDQVGFFKLSLDNVGPLRQTISFLNDPTILWYPKNENVALYYTGKLTLEALIDFVNDKAALFRDYGGHLKPNAGRIKEIDEIIRENIISILTKHNIDYIIYQVKSQAKSLAYPMRYINYYLALLKEMKKEKDPDLVIFREQNFLNKMISQKNSKFWQQYLNILTAFIEYASTGLDISPTVNQFTDETKSSTTFKQKEEIKHSAQLKPNLKWKGFWKPKINHEEL